VDVFDGEVAAWIVGGYGRWAEQLDDGVSFLVLGFLF
jgi:hypothetical protein